MCMHGKVLSDQIGYKLHFSKNYYKYLKNWPFTQCTKPFFTKNVFWYAYSVFTLFLLEHFYFELRVPLVRHSINKKVWIAVFSELYFRGKLELPLRNVFSSEKVILILSHIERRIEGVLKSAEIKLTYFLNWP